MADDIKRVGIEITAEGAKEFTASMKDIRAATKEAYSELKLAQSQYDKNTTSTKKLEDRQRYLSKVTEEYGKKAQVLEGELKELESAENRDEAAISKKRAELNQCQAKLNEYEGALKDVNQELSLHSSQLKEWGDKLQTAGGNIKEVGQNVSAVGKDLTTKLTLPLAAVGAAGVKSFAEVDKTMQLTNKTMGNTSEQADLLNRAMKDAAANSTFGMSDAATATLNFARAGLGAEEAAAALAPAMNLAAGEGGSLDTVSAGLVATINGFHGSFDEASNYADVFAAACNNSALDVDSLSHAMSVAAPIFSSAGYSVNDAALYMGVMANNGIDADKAANSLKTGLARLVSPAKDGADMMDALGISITNADGTMKDSKQVQKELHDAFGQLSESEQIAAASAIFGKNQMAPWLALINTAPEDVGDLSDSLEDCGGTTEEMADAMMSGFGGSLEKLKSSIDVLVTSLGEALAPTIQKVADFIQGLVDKFNSLSPAQQETIAKIGLLLAALGPVITVVGGIISVIGTVVGAIGAVGSAIGAAGAIMSAGGGAAAALGAAVAALGGPVTVVTGIIVALIAVGALLIANWGKIKEWAASLEKTVSKKWEDLKKAVSNTVSELKNTLTRTFSAAKTAVVTTVENLKQGAIEKFNNLKSRAQEIFENIKSKIAEKIAGAKDKVVETVENLKSKFEEKVNSLKERASQLFQDIKEKMTKPITDAKDTIDKIIGKIKGFFPIKIGKWLSDLPKITLKTIQKTVLGKTITIPTGFEWHAKAMKNAYVLDGATVFGAMNGKLLGGGEAGREIVVGEQKALDLISKASGNQELIALIKYLIKLLEYYLPKRGGVNSKELDRMLGALL